MNHSFDIEYAEKYGVFEAIMINNFQYWIIKNKANGTNNYDGHTWTYNSVKALEEIFPYWKTGQIRRCIDSLVEQDVLIKGDYNKNRYERPLWYAFANESMFLNKKYDLPKTESRQSENDKCITDVNTNVNTNTIIPPLSPKGENVRIDYKGLDKAVSEWLEYKAEKRQKYSGPKSTQTMINRLWKLSNGNPEKAMEIVLYSMSGNYQGLFEPKQNSYAPASKPSAPRKSKVKYYDTDFPDCVRVATREEYNLLVSGNPDSTFVITQEYFD